MSPRAQNLVSLGVLAVALAISSLPEKSQTLATPPDLQPFGNRLGIIQNPLFRASDVR